MSQLYAKGLKTHELSLNKKYDMNPKQKQLFDKYELLSTSHYQELVELIIANTSEEDIDMKVNEWANEDLNNAPEDGWSIVGKKKEKPTKPETKKNNKNDKTNKNTNRNDKNDKQDKKTDKQDRKNDKQVKPNEVNAPNDNNDVNGIVQNNDKNGNNDRNDRNNDRNDRNNNGRNDRGDRYNRMDRNNRNDRYDRGNRGRNDRNDYNNGNNNNNNYNNYNNNNNNYNNNRPYNKYNDKNRNNNYNRNNVNFNKSNNSYGNTPNSEENKDRNDTTQSSPERDNKGDNNNGEENVSFTFWREFKSKIPQPPPKPKETAPPAVAPPPSPPQITTINNLPNLPEEASPIVIENIQDKVSNNDTTIDNKNEIIIEDKIEVVNDDDIKIDDIAENINDNPDNNDSVDIIDNEPELPPNINFTTNENHLINSDDKNVRITTSKELLTSQLDTIYINPSGKTLGLYSSDDISLTHDIQIRPPPLVTVNLGKYKLHNNPNIKFKYIPSQSQIQQIQPHYVPVVQYPQAPQNNTNGQQNNEQHHKPTDQKARPAQEVERELHEAYIKEQIDNNTNNTPPTNNNNNNRNNNIHQSYNPQQPQLPKDSNIPRNPPFYYPYYATPQLYDHRNQPQRHDGQQPIPPEYVQYYYPLLPPPAPTYLPFLNLPQMDGNNSINRTDNIYQFYPPMQNNLPNQGHN